MQEEKKEEIPYLQEFEKIGTNNTIFLCPYCNKEYNYKDYPLLPVLYKIPFIRKITLCDCKNKFHIQSNILKNLKSYKNNFKIIK